MLRLNVEQLTQAVAACDVFQTVGKLRSAHGLLTASLPAAVGELCQIFPDWGEPVLAEVIGFAGRTAQIMPYEPVAGLQVGAPVVALNRQLQVPAGRELLGRVLDAQGRPIDGRGPLGTRRWVTSGMQAPSPLSRRRIDRPFVTGQRVIDGFLTCGLGQRIALLAGSGVGKSTLLGEIAKGASADVNVIALVGERGREVRPFLDDCLGPEGLRKSVTFVSTSDQSALMRVRAAQAAVAVACDFRAQGANVLLLLDSVTRFAMAQREIGLLRGEPPTARGYTPSVFEQLSNLLEQLGPDAHGTITGMVTVLVDGDDMNEPLTDAVRSIVDGHIVLDRQLAQKGHFPAVNLGHSISRVFRDVTTPAHQEAARRLRRIRTEYEEVANLLRIGAYTPGQSPQTDMAIKLQPALDALLQQRMDEYTTLEQTTAAMAEIAAAWPAAPSGPGTADSRATETVG